MTLEQVKNRRLKMSPAGMVTLPVSARKALGMVKGEGARCGVYADRGGVVVSAEPGADGKSWRVSKAGQLELRDDERATLETGVGRHYWLEIHDAQRRVRLVPYKE